MAAFIFFINSISHLGTFHLKLSFYKSESTFLHEEPVCRGHTACGSNASVFV